ncbi:hypothetical protein A9Q81_19385 [Gammaproteobacteria bacterium 42_54_T18]|nr:hypothetical protein A9Q81_19385 [Gammaproteobacteria bacterium 42_54_T18]
MCMRYFLLLCLFFSNPALSITWSWVGATQATVDEPTNNYGANNGLPLTLLNIDDELDSDMLDDFYGMVPEQQQVSPELLNSTFDNISIKEDFPDGEYATIKVTFLNEGAGYKNALGYFIYDTDVPPTSPDEIEHILIFPNGSKSGSGGDLLQGDQVDLKIQLYAGQSIGFFINSNGWNGNYGYQKESFLYGQPFYTLPSLNPTVGLGPRYHVILNDTESATAETGYFAYGFEDIKTSGGDKDYNDLIFNVAVTPISAVKDVEDAIELTPVSDEINSKQGTLAFEDNWPMAGDYDFNDAVLSYDITQTNNGETENQYVKEIQLNYEIKAIGATFHNGIAVSIPGLSSSMIDSVELKKTKNGVTKTINTLTEVTTYIFSGGTNHEKTYLYPLIKSEESSSNAVSFTLSEDLFEELSSFDINKLVYENRGCLFNTNRFSGCNSNVTSSTLQLTIVLAVDALLVSELGEMPFETYLFGSYKNDIYRFARGNGSVNDWFTPWSVHNTQYESADGPGPGEYLEIHQKQFSGTLKFETRYTDDDFENAKSIDAQNQINGGNPFISRQINHRGTVTGNLPWVLDLPADWKHPKERVDISLAYPNFISWVEDNNSNTDWYETDVQENRLFNK